MKYCIQLFLFVVLFAACKSETTNTSDDAPVEATAILKHKYWISKAYIDALNAPNVMDTLNRLDCGEIVFAEKDTLWMQTCRWRGSVHTFKATGVNSMEILTEGYGSETTAVLDEKTGILKVTSPEMTMEYIAFDDMSFDDLDKNPPVTQLAQKRMAGTYRLVPKKGQVASTAISELKEDGQAINFEGFNSFFPIPTGVESAFGEEKEMIMVDFRKGKADEYTICGVQLRGDTIFVYDSKEQQITNLRATYVKTK